MPHPLHALYLLCTILCDYLCGDLLSLLKMTHLMRGNNEKGTRDVFSSLSQWAPKKILSKPTNSCIEYKKCLCISILDWHVSMRTNLDTSSRGLSFSCSRSSSLHSPFPSKASFLHQQKNPIYVSIYISLLQSYTNIVLCTNFISEQAEILPQEQLGSFTGTTKKSSFSSKFQCIHISFQKATSSLHPSHHH